MCAAALTIHRHIAFDFQWKQTSVWRAARDVRRQNSTHVSALAHIFLCLWFTLFLLFSAFVPIWLHQIFLVACQHDFTHSCDFQAK